MRKTKRAAATAAANGQIESSSEPSPATGVDRWKCLLETCGHAWSAHSRVKFCPKCHGSLIARGGAPEAAPAAQRGEPRKPAGELAELLDVGKIDASPFQTRKHFDAATLAGLATSIAKVGVLQPILVRPAAGGRYELIAGERRLRAAKAARVRHIPGRIVDVTDEEAIELNARENLDRDDLDPIERALTFRQLLDKGGLTQEALAKRFGLSQEAISNSVRLLTLPEPLQARIITREISPSHAREILPWADVPTALDKIAKLAAEEVGSLKYFRRQVLDAVREASRPMDRNEYAAGGCLFQPSPAQRKQLDIRAVATVWRGSERRAFNIDLWNELNAAAKKRAKAKAATQEAARTAERQRQDDSQARRDYGRRLWALKRSWLAERVTQELDRLPATLAWKTVMIVLLGHNTAAFWRAMQTCDGLDPGDAYERLGKLEPGQLEQLALSIVREALQDFGGNLFGVGFDEAWLGLLAGQLGIDLAAEWKPDDVFLAVLDRPKREALIESWPQALIDQVRQDGCSDAAILAAWPAGFVPHDLLWVDADGEIRAPSKVERAKRPPKKTRAAKEKQHAAR